MSNKINILQITDTHIFKDSNQEMFGVNTNESLKKLVDYLLVKKIFFEKIFLTGDVSQDMSSESYAFVVEQLARLEKPVYWIPGNHDHYQTMLDVFKKNKKFILSRYLKTEAYSFIFLNTQNQDLDSGYFHQIDIDLISDVLKNSSEDEEFCVVMHHHPISTGTPLVDHYILENKEVFWNLIDKHARIKNIICGHVHGDYTLYYKNLTIHASMASCLQWKKRTKTLLAEKIIGCKLYQFSNDNVVARSITVS